MTLLQSILLIPLIMFTQLSVASPEPVTTQEVVDEVMEIAVQDSGVAQGAIIYGNLDIKYYELVKEWNKKYAYTDSSIVSYDEVGAFARKVEGKYSNSRKYLYLAKKVPSFHSEALAIVKSYRLLVSRVHVYLKSIKKDNSYRRDITEAMNNALLVYDDDLLGTLDRMKDIIEHTIKSDKIRENRIEQDKSR